MSAETRTEGVRDRDRARAMWMLREEKPKCSFCKNDAVYQYGDHLSPIYLACDGCSDAFGCGQELGRKGLIWGDVDSLEGAKDFYGERLAPWEQLARDLFDKDTKAERTPGVQRKNSNEQDASSSTDRRRIL